MANYAEETRSPELDLKWSQVIQRLKQGSWKAIYAKSDEEFDKIIDQTIQECKGYGYDECVKWSEKQAAAKYQLMLETLSSFPE